MIEFFITYNAATRQVYPLFSDLAIEYSTAKSYLLSEKQLANTLTFTNEVGDYDYLMNIIKTNQVTIFIKKDNVEVFRSTFSILSCNVNEVAQTIEAKIDVIGSVPSFEKSSIIQYNILKTTPKHVMKIKEKTEMFFELALFNLGIEPDVAEELEIVITYDIAPGTQVWILAVELSAVNIGAYWQWSNHFDCYYRSWTNNNERLANYIVKYSTQIVDGDHVLIGNMSGFYFYYQLSELVLEETETLFDNQIMLKDVLQFLFNKFSALPLVSSLFFNHNNENGVAIGNYIDQTTDLSKLSISQITDIKRYYAYSNAFIMNISLKELLDDLNGMFGELKVFIDKNNVLRIEHIAYFSTQSIDLTNIEFLNEFKNWNVDNNTKQFRENYTFVAYQRQENKAIVENTSYFNLTEIKEFSTKFLVSDIPGVISETDIFSDDLITIGLLNANNELIKSGGTFNSYLDFPNLITKYHKYNRITPIFKVNGVNVTSSTLKKIKKQEQIEVPFSLLNVSLLDFNPSYYRFKTQLGDNGEVETATYNLISDTLTLKLKYEL